MREAIFLFAQPDFKFNSLRLMMNMELNNQWAI